MKPHPEEKAGSRILIIDDEADLVEMLAFTLRKRGYRTSQAGNGLQAWEIIQGEKFDLLILDLMMPDLDGWELCRLIRRHPDPEIREVPILMLSARALPEDRIRGFELGADDYVTKPFPLAELTHRVERLLGQKHTVGDLLKKIEGLRDKMREQEAALREMIHDLKTPLITIGASAKLLMREEAPDEKIKFLRNIYENTLSLTRRLDDTLTYSDLSRDRTERRKDKIELCSLTRMVVDLFRPVGEKKGVEIRVAAPPAEINMMGEKRWIQRALENLLGNAVKYTPAGGAVVVEIGKKETPGGTMGEIRVQDNGTGIDPEDLPRIFDPFYRGRNSQGEMGVGVGLSIVKRILELHHGKVEVQSEPGKGSLFSIHFPLEPQQEDGNGASKNLQICNIPLTIP